MPSLLLPPPLLPLSLLPLSLLPLPLPPPDDFPFRCFFFFLPSPALLPAPPAPLPEPSLLAFSSPPTPPLPLSPVPHVPPCRRHSCCCHRR